MQSHPRFRVADPLLDAIERIERELQALKAALVAERGTREHEEPLEQQDYTPKQVAERLGLKPASIYAGAANTDCLVRGRIKRGTKALFPARLVEIHIANERTRGQCATCAEEYRRTVVPIR